MATVVEVYKGFKFVQYQAGDICVINADTGKEVLEDIESIAEGMDKIDAAIDGPWIDVFDENDYFVIKEDEGGSYWVKSKVGDNAGEYSGPWYFESDIYDVAYDKTHKVIELDKSTPEVKVTWNEGTKLWNSEVVATGEKSIGTDPDTAIKNAEKFIKAAEDAQKAASAKKTVKSIVDKGDYIVFETAEGKYGFMVKSTGYGQVGYDKAKSAALAGSKQTKKAALQSLGQMGVDPGTKAVDTLHLQYAQKVRPVFEQAAAEMQAKYEAAAKAYAKDLAEMQRKLDADEITAKQFKGWKDAQAAKQSANKQLAEQLANILVNADQTAAAMLNNELPKAFAENVNWQTFQIESGLSINTSFTLMDVDTVKNLIVNQPDLLPKSEVNVPKDMQWNAQKVNSAITQGILQGESVDGVAKRLMSVASMDMRSAVGAARTMLTAAQNSGRQLALERASKMGIKVKKMWQATLDGRTRSSHRVLDGESVELDKKFSNGCRFPADPQAPGFEVWGCRCRMVGDLDGVDHKDVRDYSNLPEGMSYEDWKNEHLTKQAQKLEAAQAKYDGYKAQADSLKQTLKDTNETYTGIWKDTVTLADWEAKHGSVQAKIKYYEDQIEKVKLGEAGKWVDEDTAIKKYEEMIAKTKEFDKKGKEYTKLKAEYDDAMAKAKSAKQLLGSAGGFDDTYSDERLAAAYKFTDARKADAVLRPASGSVWQGASTAERDAVFGYTGGSGKYNRPLSGFENNWNLSSYKGPGNVSLDHEGAAKAIQHMTDMVSRSTYEEDIWLVRGSGTNALESLLGIDYGKLSSLTQADLDEFIGEAGVNYAFTSCGSTVGKGFSGQVKYEIFCPAGTQMIYAEPFSAYGRGAKRRWDGISSQSGFSYEDETIIQRGTTFVFREIKKRGSSYTVVMEAHPECGYQLIT